jgi:hypothetical protein
MSSPARSNCIKACSQLVHLFVSSLVILCLLLTVRLLLLQWPSWTGFDPHVIRIESQPVTLQAEVQP